MAKINDVILSSTYNAIRGTINRVLGFGNGTDTGYGATLESSAKGGTDTIRAADMQALYNDLIKARIHQKGDVDLQWSNPEGLQSPEATEIIGYLAADVGDITDQPTFIYNDPKYTILTGIGTGVKWSIIHTGRNYNVNFFIDDNTGEVFSGQGFSAGDQILVKGTELGGIDPTHNATITVEEVGTNGEITFFSIQGEGKSVQTSEFAQDDLNQGIKDFIDAASDIDNDKDLIGPGQSSIATVATSRRSTQWSNRLDHKIRISWRDSEARRFFFNSGGQIWFYSTLTNIAGGQKELNWQSMLEDSGTVKFGKYSTTTNGPNPGSTSDFGNYSGTTEIDWTTTSESTPLRIYTKDGSGVYSENQHYIEVYQQDFNVLVFTVVFIDNDVGDPPLTPVPPGGAAGGVDEPVVGYLDSIVQLRNASGVLDIPNPSVREIDLL